MIVYIKLFFKSKKREREKTVAISKEKAVLSLLFFKGLL